MVTADEEIQAKEFLKRAEIRTMKKDLLALRESDSLKERDKIVKIKTLEEQRSEQQKKLEVKDAATAAADKAGREEILTKNEGQERTAEKELLDFGGSPEKVKIDETDHKILKAISVNARISSPELAEKTGLTTDVVRYRVNRLEKEEIIQAFRVWIDLDLIGYKFYKVLVNLQNHDEESLKKLISFCKSHKNVVYILKTLGGWDMEIEIEVRDVKDFHDFVIQLRNNFQSIIKEYQPLMIFRDYKIDYYPF